MCGIAGLFHEGLQTQERVDCLKSMLARMRHRGPDEMGYYFDDVSALGSARLSIVDIAGGQQPLGDEAGRYWIAFNGEIYNYKELRGELEARGRRFVSHCDTEVLLQAWIEWGAQSLKRLNGAFAFCIYDRVERSIVLARDRFGKRPLYYLNQSGAIVFASELKCLLAYEPFRFAFDSEQLASIFRIWTPLDEHCGFSSVRQVPAGAYLYAHGQGVETVCYAPLELDAEPLALGEEEAAEQVRAALSDSVGLRLRGDVEVGTYLSGGIDSAIITALVGAQSAGPVKSFSIRFDEDEFDESGDQQLLSSFFGTRHTSLSIGSRDIVDAFPDALWHAETPVFRTAFVPMFLLSREVNRQGIKVVLTGEGADEAFLGYDIFKETLLRADWGGKDADARQAGLSRLYPYLRQFNEQNRASISAFFDQLSGKESEDFFSHQLRFHNSQLSARLLRQKHEALKPLTELVAAAGGRFSRLSQVQRAQWLEYKTLLGGYLLSTQGDRMSLAHSVENRCPFLDPAVVRLACAGNLKFGDPFDEKHLLKRAFADQLPARLLSKPKQPYRAPDASAFLACRPDYLDAIGSESELKKIDALDPKFCLAFADKLLSKPVERISQAENQTFLFLLSTALLHRRFVERNAPEPSAIDALLTRRIDGRLYA
ncbi:asparagine synthase (glutamine-hydrolyzing) [Chromobacterium sphagni]|uniref:asparagine synthase (glutamine-hydrolyzing) n=1 Tax=Chromobacterium sphagni TaxID=1903179 RepID=A0A1S1X6N3_9NEIS|nr:asparagine synthase (glutamine-hydrolyzing) [Chromobacterium sphagni]OHX15067.1 asparagine synthase (glutamine-hydrolyzing) [Chromobacterium sphagni]OHX19452.1 asparagine synthase (glutamine-hydrolyzing) [Chromobacterium sphagni]